MGIDISGVGGSSATLVQSQTFQLAAIVSPANATNKNTTWFSSNTSVATVSNQGLVTAVAPGIAIVTVTSQDRGFQSYVTVTVTVAQSVTSVTISPKNVTIMQGQSQQLTATVEVIGGAAQDVIWTSNDESGKITVNANNGLVTVAADAATGEYLVTATSVVDGTKLDRATIVVTPSPKVLNVSIDPLTTNVTQGTTQQLTAEVVVEGGAEQTVDWESNDLTEKVVVNANGLVTIASDAIPGEYTIKAISTVDNSKFGEATITVMAEKVLTLTAGNRTVTASYNDRDPLTTNTAATLTTRNIWVRLGANTDLEARFTSSKPSNLTNLILTPDASTNVITISGTRSGWISSNILTVEVRDKQNPEVISTFTVVVSSSGGGSSLTIGTIRIQ